MFLLTDGQNTSGEPPYEKVQAMLAEMGIDDVIIHTFGYGDDHDATLMNNIANLKNGGFF